MAREHVIGIKLKQCNHEGQSGDFKVVRKSVSTHSTGFLSCIA